MVCGFWDVLSSAVVEHIDINKLLLYVKLGEVVVYFGIDHRLNCSFLYIYCVSGLGFESVKTK